MKAAKIFLKRIGFIIFVLSLPIFLSNCGNDDDPGPDPKKEEFPGTLLLDNQGFLDYHWSADGNEIYFSNGLGVFAVSIASGAMRTIDNTGFVKSIHLSADGMSLFYFVSFSVPEVQPIVRIRVDGADRQEFVPDALTGAIVFSPDDSKVAYHGADLVVGDNGFGVTYVYDFNTQIADSIGIGQPRIFNPEGTRLVVRRPAAPDNDTKIFIADLEDGSTEDLDLDVAFSYDYKWNESGLLVGEIIEGRLGYRNYETDEVVFLAPEGTEDFTIHYNQECTEFVLSQSSFLLSFMGVGEFEHMIFSFNNVTSVAEEIAFYHSQFRQRPIRFSPDNIRICYAADNGIWLLVL